MNDIEIAEVPGWEDFQDRKNGGGKAAAVPIRRPSKRKRALAAESKAPELADVLMQAVKLAIARRARPAREIQAREETLLDVLSAMRGPAR